MTTSEAPWLPLGSIPATWADRLGRALYFAGWLCATERLPPRLAPPRGPGSPNGGRPRYGSISERSPLDTYDNAVSLGLNP